MMRAGPSTIRSKKRLRVTEGSIRSVCNLAALSLESASLGNEIMFARTSRDGIDDDDDDDDDAKQQQ